MRPSITDKTRRYHGACEFCGHTDGRCPEHPEADRTGFTAADQPVNSCAQCWRPFSAITGARFGGSHCPTCRKKVWETREQRQRPCMELTS